MRSGVVVDGTYERQRFTKWVVFFPLALFVIAMFVVSVADLNDDVGSFWNWLSVVGSVGWVWIAFDFSKCHVIRKVADDR